MAKLRFCNECGTLIMNGDHCPLCGTLYNKLQLDQLKIITPDEYIDNRKFYRENYDKFLDLISNKDEIEFSKEDILKYFNEVIDIANTNFINKEKQKFSEILPDKYIPNSQIEKIKIENNIPFKIEKIIEDHNDKFIKKQMASEKEFFDNIDGKSLKERQRIAVLTDDDNTQIVAGAGTGKTLTLQAKVKYLIEKKNIAPEDILCISFSNSARDDLDKKLKRTLNNVPIEVKTFHSLGYKILGINDQNKEIPEYEMINLIDNYIKNNYQDKSQEILEFFIYYFNSIYYNEENLNFETIQSRLFSLDEYDEYLQEYLNINKPSRKREYVNSVDKLIISNYLFIHNIKYEYNIRLVYKNRHYDNYLMNLAKYLFLEDYESIPKNLKEESLAGFIENYEEELHIKSLNYYPEFYLPEYDVYISLDSSDEIDVSLPSESNKSFDTKVIFFNDKNNDSIDLINQLQDSLMDANISIDHVNWKKLFELLILQDKLPEYKLFIKTIGRFINLFKGNMMNLDYNGNDVSDKKFESFLNINKVKFSGTIQKRNEFYLNTIKDTYKMYKNHLNDEFIDFDDMINDAIIELRNGGYIHKYKYIIVDEYQDTSHTRYQLLKEVQNVTGAKLVVVGDDWQSIYGFTGCDVNLFSQFNNYFKNPKVVKLNVTHRNSQKLIDIAGDFIQKNKLQITKKLISEKNIEKPIKLFDYVSRAEEVLALIKILNNISNENPNAEVLILGRNNRDIYEISCKKIFTTKKFKDFTTIKYEAKPNLKIEFRTIHKSKGLERDYVIVLNLNNQINGFPNKIANDPILNFVNNNKNENIAYPEERRLFYVALTRTKNDVYIFYKSMKPSSFIDEIKNKDGVEKLNYVFDNKEIIEINKLLEKRFEVHETEIDCPICKKGKVNLIVNNERGTSYFRCSNFCNWEGASYHNRDHDDGTRNIHFIKYAKACPSNSCNGILIVRQNRSDKTYFLGCSSYPDCKRTEDINLKNNKIQNLIPDLNSEDFFKTRFGVYYLSKYVPDEKRETYKNNEDINFSEHLLEYKNKDTVYINLFSNKLAKFISRFSKEKISAEINKLALIAVPSSKVHKKTSAIKKSIEIIDEWYDNGDLKKIYGCDKEIINYKDLLKRVKDVPTAHLGEGRATPIEHIKSIECENDNLNNEKIAYIILDDITTTGDTMQACNEILLESGANPKNIFNIAIGATVREEGEEI